MDLMALLEIQSQELKLNRDIIFLAVADEEYGSTSASWMIKSKKKLLAQAEYLIDEGSGVILGRYIAKIKNKLTRSSTRNRFFGKYRRY